MTTKADFNAEEWSAIVEAPVLAGLRVVASGRGGTLRESLAMGRVYKEARRNQAQNELVDEIVASPPALDVRQLQERGDLGTLSTERVREAVRLLSEKGSPEALDEYRRFVLAVAQAAAEAHKEGGFVGIGGKPVSDEEQRAIDELRGVLDAG
jgi:hypothetical protein